MRRLAALGPLLFVVACSTPSEKDASTNGQTNANNVQCSTDCPDHLASTIRTDGVECVLYDHPECYTCCIVPPPDLCGNNDFGHAVCPDGLLAVDECPAGEDCELVSDVCPDEQLCAPLRTIDSTIPTQDGDRAAFVTACETDEDCALVYTGDVCGCLECPTGSVANESVEDYEAVLSAARDRCESLTTCGDAPCVEHLAHCDLESGTCVGRQSKYVTTTGAPVDCEVASDCQAVFEGEVCDPCRCPNAAVRADFVDTYQTAFDVECAHSVACDCPEVTVECAEAVCTAQ